MRQNIIYLIWNSVKLMSVESRVCSFWYFFERSIFFWECMGSSFSPRRLCLYINSCYLIVLCVDILSLTGFTSLFILVRPLTSFEVRFCTWWLWRYRLFTFVGDTKFTLVCLYIGVTTDKFFLEIKFDSDLWVFWRESPRSLQNPNPALLTSSSFTGNYREESRCSFFIFSFFRLCMERCVIIVKVVN